MMLELCQTILLSVAGCSQFLHARQQQPYGRSGRAFLTWYSACSQSVDTNIACMWQLCCLMTHVGPLCLLALSVCRLRCSVWGWMVTAG